MTVAPFLWQDLVQVVKESPEISNPSGFEGYQILKLVYQLRDANNFLKSQLNQYADQLSHKMFRDATILPKKSH